MLFKIIHFNGTTFHESVLIIIIRLIRLNDDKVIN